MIPASLVEGLVTAGVIFDCRRAFSLANSNMNSTQKRTSGLNPAHFIAFETTAGTIARTLIVFIFLIKQDNHKLSV